MYAKIVSTQWGFGEPAGSRIEGFDLWLNHEPDCPMQRSLATRDSCDCYVSRLRLIETPMGEQLATPEPDRKADVDYWRGRALHAESRCNVLWIGLLFSLAVAGISLFGLVFELGLA